jgi:hypothetical protein
LTGIAAGCGILSVRGAFYQQRFVDEQTEREAAGA